MRHPTRTELKLRPYVFTTAFRVGSTLGIALAVMLAACGGGSPPKATPAPPTVTSADAEARLRQIVLRSDDVGAEYTTSAARLLTNDDAAQARPDTENARKQYADWGQALQYNVQYAAPVNAQLVFNGKVARVMNTATIFQTIDGATAALAYIRGLSPALVANFLVNESAGTKITDTQVVKDIGFDPKGDDSFAWRLSGKATFAGGFTVNFVADTVWVRAGRVSGNVTAVALGEAPQRDLLTRLVDTFVARARAKG